MAHAQKLGQSQWTILNHSEAVRDYERRFGNAMKKPSRLNVCKLITLGSSRGTLSTSDNLTQVYPVLKSRKPHGETNLMLITGKFQEDDYSPRKDPLRQKRRVF